MMLPASFDVSGAGQGVYCDPIREFQMISGTNFILARVFFSPIASTKRLSWAVLLDEPPHGRKPISARRAYGCIQQISEFLLYLHTSYSSRITDHQFARRGGRAVDCTGLENRQAERPREFESHPLRSPLSLSRLLFSFSAPRRDCEK